MSKLSDSTTVLDLIGAYASVNFTEGLRFPRDLLDRSSVLRQALSDAEETSKVPLVVRQDLLQSWLQWRMAESSWDSSYLNEVTQIVQFLQAADYLGDEEGCSKLCRQAAEAVLPPPPDQSPVRESHVKVLDTLPDNLRDAIIAACSFPLPHLLSVLPPRMHMAAMQAAYPNAVGDACMHVEPKHLLTGQETIDRFWCLILQFSSMQHLSIDLSDHVHRSTSSPQPIAMDVAYPDPLSGLTALTYLQVRGAMLQIQDSVTGGRGWNVGKLTALRHLELVHTGIGREGMGLLAPQLMHLSGLHHLNLCRNPFGLAGLHCLAQCLPKLCCLQHLDLASNSIRSDGATLLKPYLASLSRLTYFCFQGNVPGDEEKTALAQLFLNLPSLQKLKSVYRMVGDLLVPQLSRFTALRSLTLMSPQEDWFYAELRVQLAALTSLTHLEFYFLSDDEDMQALASAIGKLSGLRVLHLSDGSFGGEGITVILSHITHLTDLQGLYVHGDELSDSAMTALCHYLKTLPPLQHLEVGDECTVSGKVATVLAACLSSFTMLTRLEFQLRLKVRRTATESAAVWQTLAQSLMILKRLKHLHLMMKDCMVLQPNDLHPLEQAVGTLTALDQLHIYADMLGGTSASSLCTNFANLHRLQVLDLHLQVFDMNEEEFFSFIKVLEGLPVLQRLSIISGVHPEQRQVLEVLYARHGHLHKLYAPIRPQL